MKTFKEIRAINETKMVRVKLGDLVRQESDTHRVYPIYKVVTLPDANGDFSGVRYVKTKKSFANTRTHLSTHWKGLKKIKVKKL